MDSTEGAGGAGRYFNIQILNNSYLFFPNQIVLVPVPALVGQQVLLASQRPLDHAQLRLLHVDHGPAHAHKKLYRHSISGASARACACAQKVIQTIHLRCTCTGLRMRTKFVQTFHFRCTCEGLCMRIKVIKTFHFWGWVQVRGPARRQKSYTEIAFPVHVHGTMDSQRSGTNNPFPVHVQGPAQAHAPKNLQEALKI